MCDKRTNFTKSSRKTCTFKWIDSLQYIHAVNIKLKLKIEKKIQSHSGTLALRIEIQVVSYQRMKTSRKLRKAATVFRRLDNVWKSGSLELSTELQLYAAVVVSTASGTEGVGHVRSTELTKDYRSYLEGQGNKRINTEYRTEATNDKTQ